MACVDNFLINRVTINVGDTVVWNGKALANGFHSVNFPKKGGKPLPLIVPTGKQVTGVLDAAGNPFWFNNVVPQLGFNPQLFAPSGGKTYNGSKAVDSGLPLGKPKDFKLKFTKAGRLQVLLQRPPRHGRVRGRQAEGSEGPDGEAGCDDAQRDGEGLCHRGEGPRQDHSRAQTT